MARSGSFNEQLYCLLLVIKQMYTKIVNDMKDSQLENGLIPNTAPEYASFPHDFRDSPEWGSAGVILPWFLYDGMVIYLC